MKAAPPVPRERVSTPKLRLFAANGQFLQRTTPAQCEALLTAGLAERRGNDLRMVAMEMRRGLDGLYVTRRETAVNARGCYSFATRTMPDGGEATR